jgi:hypothetical protein
VPLDTCLLMGDPVQAQFVPSRRAKLATNPSVTGSLLWAMTIGIVLVASLDVLANRSVDEQSARITDLLHSAQILNRVDNHSRADGDQQDVGSRPHVTVTCRRRSELHDKIRGQVIEHHIPRQRPADVPLFRLAGRHAAVAFFCEAGRAPARLKLPYVVIANHDSMPVAEVTNGRAAPLGGTIRFFVAIACVSLSFCLPLVAGAGPRRFVRERWIRHQGSDDKEHQRVTRLKANSLHDAPPQRGFSLLQKRLFLQGEFLAGRVYWVRSGLLALNTAGSAAHLPNDFAAYLRQNHLKTVRIGVNDAPIKSY